MLSSWYLKSNFDRRRPLPVDLGVRTLHAEWGDSRRLSLHIQFKALQRRPTEKSSNLLMMGALVPALVESITIVPGTRRDSMDGEEG